MATCALLWRAGGGGSLWDEIQRISEFANAAMHLPAPDQRNNLEDIAQRLADLLRQRTDGVPTQNTDPAGRADWVENRAHRTTNHRVAETVKQLGQPVRPVRRRSLPSVACGRCLVVEPTTDNSAAAGVMVGGDQDEVRNELLAEVKRGRVPSGVPAAAHQVRNGPGDGGQYAELMAHMDGGGDYFEFMAKRRHAPGVTVTPSVPRLPACKQCDGKGERLENGTVFVCGGCLGNGVQMDENSPYTGESGWKLHRCADGGTRAAPQFLAVARVAGAPTLA